MLKDIKYTGLNTVSSGYDATAGQLAVAHNVINERGYIEPMTQPHMLLDYATLEVEGYTCMFKHEMLSGVVNYIFYKPADDESSSSDSSSADEGSLMYWTEGSDNPVAQPITWDAGIASAQLYEITAVGNTLCVLTSAGMDYFVWKTRQVNGVAVTTYYELGTELPFVNLQFGLKVTNDRNNPYYFAIHNCRSYHDGASYIAETLAQKEKIKEGVEASVNLARDSAKSQGCFVEPFLVRYAIKLFDGTYIHHSSPVLLEPQGYLGFPFHYTNAEWPDANSAYFCNDYKMAELQMLNLDPTQDLSDWSDIIDGIDLFVSSAIPSRDYRNITNFSAGNFYNSSQTTNRGAYMLGSYVDTDYPPADEFNPHTVASPTNYKIVDYRDCWPATKYNGSSATYCNFLQFAYREFKPDDVSLFYKVRTFATKDLADYSSLTTLNIPAEVLQALETQQILPDDYKSHDQLIPKGAYTYNQRINIFDTKRIIWNRMNPNTYLPYWSDGDVYVGKLFITVSDEDGERILDPGYSWKTMYKGAVNHIRYFYVPYPNAVKVEIHITPSPLTPVGLRASATLKRHSMLTGAVYFDEWADASVLPSITPPSDVSKVEYTEPNKVYTSEVGNPYNFPLGGVNTVGTGKILALASNVRAISQGQFGEFPLYVFTESGIWMLEVDDKGLYKAKQPMSLDIIEPGSQVTSVDNAVAYVIKRGLMLVSGSETRCISEALDGIAEPTPNLPQIIGGKTEQFNWNEYKKGAVCAYDNVNQRLHVYNPNYAFDWLHDEKPYHYVYSLKTGLWSTVEDDNLLLSTINGRYINTADGLLDITFEEDNHDALTQTILTRPVNFETDAYKRMRDNIQRGDLDLLRTTAGCNVKVLLQGSDDLHNWHNIGGVSKHYRIVRKSGTPHKWFRWMIVISCNPKMYRLHGLTADVEVTGNNKLR